MIENKVKLFLFKYGLIIVTSLIFFFFGPLFSLPFIVWGIFQNNRQSIFFILLLSCFFGYIAFYFEPLIEDDLYRHYETMSILSNLNIIDAIFYDVNIINNLIFYILAKLNIMRFYTVIGTTLTYFFSMKSVYVMNDLKKFSKTEIIMIFLLSILIWPFRLVTSGIRNFVVISILVYWFIAKENDIKDIKSIILIVFCFFIHSYTLFFILFYLLFKYLPTKYYLSFIICLVTILFLGDIFIPYLQNIPFLGYYATKYISYRNIVDYYDFYTLLYIFIRIFFVLVILLIFKITKYENKYTKILKEVLVFSFIIESRTFTERNLVMIAFISFLLLIYYMNNNYKLKKYFVPFLIICCTLFSILNYPTLKNYPLNKPLISISTSGYINIFLDNF